MHVYVITHLPTGRKYVGKANDVQRRWSGHKRKSRSTTARLSYFHAAIRKYGESQFVFSWVLPYGTEKEAFAAEVVLIAALRSNEKEFGFNLDSGGQGGKTPNAEVRQRMSVSHLGKTPTPETRAKMSAAQVGKKRRAGTGAKISAANTGRKRSPEARARIAEGNRNKPPVSAETRAKLSIALTGKKRAPFSEETRARMSAARKGKPANRSPEHQAKLSAILRERNARQKKGKSSTTQTSDSNT